MILISDYGTLKIAVETYLARTDLTQYIPGFIQQCETRVNKLRIRQFEKAYSETISSGTTPVPSDYMETKVFRIDGYKPLGRASLEQVYTDHSVRSDLGTPKVMAREGSTFVYGPAPDSDYTVQGIYYAKPAAMSADADAPDLLLESPNLYLFGSLAAAQPFVRDEQQIQLWTALYTDEYQALKDASNEEDYSGGQLVMTRG